MSKADDRTPLHMWSYWREKKGITRALEQYFPELLSESNDLRMALFTMQQAETLIERIMVRLEDEEGPPK